MPVFARFYGILIKMYFREHGVPHFHAIYGEYATPLDAWKNTVRGSAHLGPSKIDVVSEEGEGAATSSLHETGLLPLRGRITGPIAKAYHSVLSWIL